MGRNEHIKRADYLTIFLKMGPDYPADGSGMMATVSGYAVEEIYTKGKMWPFFLQKPAISPGTCLVTGREDAVAAGDDFTGENVRDGV